jgi:hypothetical protein
MSKPLFSETQFAQKVGAVVAARIKHPEIPAERWSAKLVRLVQRLLFVGLVVLAVKLVWPWYVICGSALLALRALAPELTDSGLKWLASIVRLGKAVKDS